MLHLTARFTVAIGLMALVSGCGGSRTDGGADVKVDGSSTVYPITEAVAEELRGKRRDLRVTVAKSGTGGGMKKFGKGEIDICDASREMKGGEGEVCDEAGIKHDHFMVA